MDNRSDDQLLGVIWKYLAIEDPLRHADVIIAGGTNDTDVAHYAAELYSMSFAPMIVFSGQQAPQSTMTRADIMTKVARSYDIPEAAILKESDAKNAPQTIALSQQLLTKEGITPQTILLVNTPYMARTFRAAAEAQWQGTQPVFISRHESTSLPEYSLRHGRGETIRNILGNFQRLNSYAKKGYQSQQIIPEDVQAAYDTLIWRGHKTR